MMTCSVVYTIHDKCQAQQRALIKCSSHELPTSSSFMQWWHGLHKLRRISCCCKMMIERTGGCPHMTCRCGNAFQMKA